MSEAHPLEGKYILYNYGEQDNEDECWALALFRLEEKKMERIFHPADHVDAAHEMRSKLNDKLLELMKKRDIKEVYTVFHLEDFFGIPARWVDLEDEETKERRKYESAIGLREPDLEDQCGEWFEYKSVDEYADGYQLLIDNGIIIHRYDNTVNKKKIK